MKPTDKIAFVGPNTLAATTLFKILSGEMEPDSGALVLISAVMTGVAHVTIKRKE